MGPQAKGVGLHWCERGGREGGRRGAVSSRWCPSQRVGCAAALSEGWRPLRLRDRVRLVRVIGSHLARVDHVVAAERLLAREIVGRAHRDGHAVRCNGKTLWSLPCGTWATRIMDLGLGTP